MSALDLEAAKAALNITVGEYDAKLQSTIDAAEATLAQKCGPLQPVARTDRVRPNGGVLLLAAPVASLTTVTDADGTAVAVGDLYVDESGVVERLDGSPLTSRVYTVAYQHGRSECPSDLLKAVEELVRHLWVPQRGPTRRPGSAESEGASNTIPGAGYLLPFRVQELIAPHMNGGFA